MKIWKWVFVGVIWYAGLVLSIGVVELGRSQHIERIFGSARDVLEDDPVGRLKVFVYKLPSKYNKKILPIRTLNLKEADWFYNPVYTTCDLTPNGLPLPFKSPRMMRSAIKLISSNWPYWNRAEGAEHFFVVLHDFGACFHYQEEKAIERGILPLLQRATLKMQTHLILEEAPRSIFVYFRGLFYNVGNDPKGGYYASPRLVEVVIFGCIPVIIADDIVLPFADAIPWEEIGVFIDEKDVPNLDTILTSIPPEVILRKQRLLANPSMKQAMLFPQPSQAGDAFPSSLEWTCMKIAS
ncbi:hypothetical protein H0E87_025554 [Populus deltoides]|uniref:Exostosin GT47 domain-containing protein n=1 Tax=Populus deltoides TaxID=3696 RepID=A0A8T2X019_POPDE|nr:hypothetical protein H0E87_025554 [Populus deltoides]